jgi:hypothetical protein
LAINRPRLDEFEAGDGGRLDSGTAPLPRTGLPMNFAKQGVLRGAQGPLRPSPGNPRRVTAKGAPRSCCGDRANSQHRASGLTPASGTTGSMSFDDTGVHDLVHIGRPRNMLAAGASWGIRAMRCSLDLDVETELRSADSHPFRTPEP